MNHADIASEIQAENKQAELANIAPAKIQRWQISAAAIIWQVGIILIDAVTAFLVWQITYWWYGVLWFLAGSVGLIYSENLRERIGNNDTQTKIGQWGVGVSTGMVLVAAIFAGVVYETGEQKTAWAEIAVLVSTVLLFFYHVAASYVYHAVDDDYKARNEDAKRQAAHEKELKVIHRAAERVEAKRKAAQVREQYREKYGDAFDAAYKPNVAMPTAPMASFNATAPAPLPALAPNPTNGSVQSQNRPE